MNATGDLSLRQRALALKPYVPLGLLLVLTGFLYLPTILAWFETDDLLFLNSFHHASFAGYVKSAFDIRHAPPFPEVRFYRPLQSSVFLTLYHIFGLRAAPYHVWSLALHLFNICMLWTITRRLTKQPLVPILAAAIFALHPSYSQAVAWISNNNALMASAAALFAFWCFINAEESRQARWYLIAAGSYGAALLFHPEAGTMIVVLFAYHALFTVRDWSEARGWRTWVALLPFLVIAAGYLTIHRWMLHNHFLPQAENFSVNPHMLTLYLAYFSMSLYPVSAVEWAKESYHQGVFALAMLCALGFLTYQATAKGRRISALAVLWYLIALAPLSTGSGAFIQNLIDGRKLYTAGPPLALMLALVLAPIFQSLAGSPRRAAQAALVAVCITAVSLAGLRMVTYQNNIAAAADQSNLFLTELRTTYPEMPAGTRLFVIGAPPYLVPYYGVTDVYLQAIVDLYYDGVNVEIGHEGSLPPFEAGDLVFHYQEPP